MTKFAVALIVAVVATVVAAVAIVFAITRPLGMGVVIPPPAVVAALPGPSVSGQCALTPTSGLIIAPGKRLGCSIAVDVPVLWPVLWTEASGQLGAQPGTFTVGAMTSVRVELPGQPVLGGGR